MASPPEQPHHLCERRQGELLGKRINLLRADLFRANTNIFAFFIISLHWDDVVSFKSLLVQYDSHLYYIANVPWRRREPGHQQILYWSSYFGIVQVPHVKESNILRPQRKWMEIHYSYVIMSAMAYQITSVSIVCLTICSSGGQRNHQSSALLAFASLASHRASKADFFHLMTSSWFAELVELIISSRNPLLWRPFLIIWICLNI